MYSNDSWCKQNIIRYGQSNDFFTSLHAPGYSPKWFLMGLKPLSWVNDLMQDAPLIGL